MRTAALLLLLTGCTSDKDRAWRVTCADAGRTVFDGKVRGIVYDSFGDGVRIYSFPTGEVRLNHVTGCTEQRGS